MSTLRLHMNWSSCATRHRWQYPVVPPALVRTPLQPPVGGLRGLFDQASNFSNSYPYHQMDWLAFLTLVVIVGKL
ncbi:MAG TPA: hypothetical protein VGQ08_05695 [Nitrospiraceae bacterium]|nr:hypothetical protein [Nitrospiraceae bacterium]